MAGRTDVLDGTDVDIIVMDRAKGDWDSSEFKGSKKFKCFMSIKVDEFSQHLRCREAQCPCPKCRTNPVLLLDETCAYSKWIGGATGQALIFTVNPKKQAATRPAVTAQKERKAGALSDMAKGLNSRFAKWQQENAGTSDPVVVVGAGEEELHLARLHSKAIQAGGSIWRGEGRDRWCINKGDWYCKIQYLNCADQLAQLYEDGDDDVVLLQAMLQVDSNRPLFDDEVDDFLDKIDLGQYKGTFKGYTNSSGGAGSLSSAAMDTGGDGVTGVMLSNATNSDLTKFGVRTVAHRTRILNALKTLQDTRVEYKTSPLATENTPRSRNKKKRRSASAASGSGSSNSDVDESQKEFMHLSIFDRRRIVNTGLYHFNAF